MTREFMGWIRDVSRYLQLGVNRNLSPRLRAGTDYTHPRYKNMVRTVVDRIHPRRMKLQVSRIIDETPSTRTFRFQRSDGPLPPFRPGQYVNLFVQIDDVKTSRPYSISSRPDCGYLDITLRDNPGGFVAPYLHRHLEEGDVLESTGPVGSFHHEPLIDSRDLLFIAGGTGITPFMSIIRDQAARGWDLNIQLLYGSRLPSDVIFGEELSELADRCDNFAYSLVISEPPKDYRGLTGFLDGKLISQQVGDLAGKTIYICGPTLMYDLCLAELKGLNAPAHRIRRELYGPPRDVTEEPGWPEGLSAETLFEVDVVGVKRIQASATEPLICSLERHGIVVPALCRSGECSACRTKILSGSVFMPAHTGVRESDRQHGYVHACVAYPITDLTIRL